MKNIYSNIFAFNEKILKKLKDVLIRGNVIGLPTETVYGLAGNAYSKKSVDLIYKLKKRPKKNPLIVHYLDYKSAEQDVFLNKKFFRLYRKFCPGPITFILRKKTSSKIPKTVTANLNTIAIRFPSHKIIRTILKNNDFPLAMPSANVSSGISPINAENVADEFKKNIKMIIDGGKSKIGIESTVVDLTGKPKILRPGIISHNFINKVLSLKMKPVNKSIKIKSPGMFKRHYSPGIPMFLDHDTVVTKHAFITFGNKFHNKKNYFNLSKKGNLNEAASNLYEILRKIKKLKYKRIYVSKIPNKGVGIAINDRLKRAAY